MPDQVPRAIAAASSDSANDSNASLQFHWHIVTSALDGLMNVDCQPSGVRRGPCRVGHESHERCGTSRRNEVLAKQRPLAVPGQTRTALISDLVERIAELFYESPRPAWSAGFSELFHAVKL